MTPLLLTKGVHSPSKTSLTKIYTLMFCFYIEVCLCPSVFNVTHTQLITSFSHLSHPPSGSVLNSHLLCILFKPCPLIDSDKKNGMAIIITYQGFNLSAWCPKTLWNMWTTSVDAAPLNLSWTDACIHVSWTCSTCRYHRRQCSALYKLYISMDCIQTCVCCCFAWGKCLFIIHFFSHTFLFHIHLLTRKIF